MKNKLILCVFCAINPTFAMDANRPSKPRRITADKLSKILEKHPHLRPQGKAINSEIIRAMAQYEGLPERVEVTIPAPIIDRYPKVPARLAIPHSYSPPG